MAVRMVDEIMKPDHKKHHKSAIRVIEEAIHLLRSAPGSLLAGYYLGSVPFVLGFMYFWADMSRSAKAGDHNVMAALGLAFLYVWMKFWHNVFAHQVRAQVAGEGHCQWSWGRIGSIAATQALIQSTRFIMLPVAGVIMVPFGFCYAFYQNVTACVEEGDQPLTSTCKWAWRQARLWPRQNHLLIGILWLFGVVIFFNFAFTTFMIPQMAKTLFGIESVFTLAGLRMILNTTFWIAVMGMTFLCLDPLIKTVYVLRCFYGSALKSGEDLEKELNQLSTRGKKMAAVLLAAAMWAAPLACLAEQPVSPSSAELDRSIEEILERREFAWRMPRETVPEEEARGPLEAAIKWLIDMISKVVRTLGDWISQFFEWLENLLPQPDKQSPATKRNWITPLRAVLISFLILSLVILAFVFIRIWRRQRPGPAETMAAAIPPSPDLNDENIKADDLPTNRWLVLAEEYTTKGELRLAMRALYLATLAHLSEHEMITIEIYKSNREYEDELNRRAHERRELLSVFSKSLNLFERVWYGMYRISRIDFDNFRADQKRILTFAEN